MLLTQSPVQILQNCLKFIDKNGSSDFLAGESSLALSGLLFS